MRTVKNIPPTNTERVDFEYVVDGQKYAFSMAGGESIDVGELLEKIGVCDAAERESFVAEIENVEFSDPELVEVVHTTTVFGIGKDTWVLKSLAPFSTEETLTVTMKDGQVFTVKVTDDAEFVTDITNLLTSAVITIDGRKVTGSEWNVRANQEYDIALRFKETSVLQFSDDEPMIYYLPAALEVTEGFSSTFDVSVDGKTVKGNTYTIKKDASGNFYLEISWNQSDPNIATLKAAGTASIVIDIKAKIDKDATEIVFSDTVEKDVNIDNTSNVSITKTGWYDKDNQKIHYTIIAKSVGESSNVVVSDRISGSAVKMESDDSITMTRNGSTTAISKNSDGKGFSYSIGNMNNGEEVKFEYTASVDPSLISKSGEATFDETGNTVNITSNNDGDPKDNTSTHYESGVSFNSSISKNSTSIGELVEVDGKYYKTVSWKVELNSEKQVAMYGSDIKDTIQSWCQDKMSYTGNGISISVDDGAATTIPWSSLGVTTDTTATGIRGDSNKTWSYTFSSDADKTPHKYTITYDTLVQIANLNEDITASNTIEGKPGKDTAYAPVNKGGQGEGGGGEQPSTGPTVTKAYTYADDKTVTWKISVVASGEGYTAFKIEDIFPYCGYNNALKDSLVGEPIVSGLLSGESYSTTDLKTVIGEQEVSYGIRFDFYQDEEKTISGLKKNVVSNEGGVEKTSDRIITITLTTKNNEQWMQETADDVNNAEHVNKVNVYTSEGDSKAEAKVTPRTKKITKRAVVGWGYSEGSHTNTDTVTIDGVVYPVYKYVIEIQGATDDKIEIDDVFDTEALKVFDGNPDPQNQFEDLGLLESSNSAYYNPHVASNLTIVPTETGAKITGTLPRTDDGALYVFNRLIYYLIPNGPEGIERLKELAIDNDGVVQVTNTATYDKDASDSTYVEYEYNPVEKSVTTIDANALYHYKIVLNKDKRTLNNGNILPMTDTFSGITVDYATITVTTDPAENSKDVTWDYSQSTGYFNIPDATKVTIEYDARPIGSGNVTMTNTAEMKGFSASTSETADVSGSGKGTAVNGHLRLMKYAEGDMTAPLSGAVFGLYEKDGDEYKAITYPSNAKNGKAGQPIQYTTGANGIVDLSLDSSIDGIYLEPEYIDAYDNTLVQGKTYYIREEVAPDGYELVRSPEYYSFKITTIPENVSYGGAGGYVYINDDIMKIVNKPAAGIRLKKIVKGVDNLSSEQKNNITFVISGPNGYYRIISYADFTNDQYKLPDAVDIANGITHLSAGNYTVTETYTDVDGNILRTQTYKLDSQRAHEYEAGNENGNVEFEITDEDIANNKDHTVTVTNTYQTTNVKLLKTNENRELLSGATFQLLKKNASGYAVMPSFSAVEITDQNKAEGISFDYLTDGDYCLVETVAPSGYKVKSAVYFKIVDGVVSYTQKVDGVSFDDSSNTFTVEDEKAPTTITVKKEWVGPIPSGKTIYVRLLARDKGSNGDFIDVANHTLSADENWEYTWTGLDVNKEYKVHESISVDNYTTTYSQNNGSASTGDTITVTNTYNPTGVAVQKKWLVSDETSIPDSVTVQLMEASATPSQESIAVNIYDSSKADGDTFKETIYVKSGTNVILTGNPIQYGISKITITGRDNITSSSDGKVVIENITEPVDIKFYCSWGKGKQFSWSYTPDVVVNKNAGSAVGSPIQISASNNWYYEWSGLDSSKFYYIVETKVGNKTLAQSNYIALFSNNDGINTGTIALTNTETTEATGTKKWVNTVYDSSYSANNAGNSSKALIINDRADLRVEMQLVRYIVNENGTVTRDGVVEGSTIILAGEDTKNWGDSKYYKEGVYEETTTVAHGDTWTAKWSNLPKYGTKDGKTVEYTYQAEEVSVRMSSRYNRTDGNVAYANDAFTPVVDDDGTIINTFKLIDIPVTKSWENWPDGAIVTVKLFRKVGGSAREETGLTLTLTKDNPRQTFTDLPAYGADTSDQRRIKEVTYSIEEVVAGVSSESFDSVTTGNQNSGFTITNTNNAPQTGSLAITKEVSGGANATGKIFTFEATLSNADDTPYVGNVTVVDSTRTTATTATTDANGKITVTVSGTGTATLSDIPAGTTYVVAEPTSQLPEGWSMEGTVEYSDPNKNISAGDADTAIVTNTYSATGSVDFKQTKIFTNGTASMQFGYTITEYGDSNYRNVISVITNTGTMSQSEPGTTTVSYTLNSTTKGVIGNHYYIVKENLPSGTATTATDISNGYVIVNGIKYDLTEHKYVVNVSDNGSGNLVVKKDGNAVETITSNFTNEQLGSVTVTKVVSGTTLPEGFKITNNYNNDEFTVSNKTGGSGTEDDPYTWTIDNVPLNTAITFTESGIQVAGYGLTVNGTAVTDTTATASTTWNGTAATAEFTNAYTEQPGSLKLKKEVTVNGTVAASQTTDNLKKLADGTYIFTVASTTLSPQVSKTVTIVFENGAVKEAKVDNTAVELNDGWVVVDDLPADSYSVTEQTPTNGTALTGVTTTGNGSVSDNVATLVVAAGDTATVPTATFTNNAETTSIKVKKEWGDSKDHSNVTIPFSVVQFRPTSGTDYVATDYTITSSVKGDGTVTEITGLPKYGFYDGARVTYRYDIIEGKPDETIREAYTASRGTTLDDGTLVMVNTPVSDKDKHTDLTVEKIWKDGDNTVSNTNDSITFRLERYEISTDYVPVEFTNNAYNFSGNQASSGIWYVPNNSYFEITFNHFPIVGFGTIYYSVNGTDGTIPNNEKVSLKITEPTKIDVGGWGTVSNAQPANGTVSYRTAAQLVNAKKNSESTKNGEYEYSYNYSSSSVTSADGAPPATTEANSWIANLNNLDEYIASSGKIYTYQITEVKINDDPVILNQTDDYSVSIAESSTTAGVKTTITNTKKDHTELVVEKKWLGVDGVEMETKPNVIVEFKLTQHIIGENGTEITSRAYVNQSNNGVYELKADNSWQQKFDGLPKTGTYSYVAQGQTEPTTVAVSYQYSVEETKINKIGQNADMIDEYNISYQFTVKNGSNPDEVTSEYLINGDGTLTITNKTNSSVELPSTGGIGTTTFKILGTVLIAFAGGFFLFRRRRLAYVENKSNNSSKGGGGLW